MLPISIRQLGNITSPNDIRTTHEMQSNETPLSGAACPLTCELTTNPGYVVYSALGSFYIPMLVMLFFYWRIYRAAVRTTRAINQGFKTTKGKVSLDACFKASVCIPEYRTIEFILYRSANVPSNSLSCPLSVCDEYVLNTRTKIIFTITRSKFIDPKILTVANKSLSGRRRYAQRTIYFQL